MLSAWLTLYFSRADLRERRIAYADYRASVRRGTLRRDALSTMEERLSVYGKDVYKAILFSLQLTSSLLALFSLFLTAAEWISPKVDGFLVFSSVITILLTVTLIMPALCYMMASIGVPLFGGVFVILLLYGIICRKIAFREYHAHLILLFVQIASGILLFQVGVPL